MNVKKIQKMIESAEKRADAAGYNYQCTGLSRYDRTRRDNEDLAEILRIALNANDEHTKLISIRSDIANLASKADIALYHKKADEAVEVLNNLIAVARTYEIYDRRF